MSNATKDAPKADKTKANKGAASTDRRNKAIGGLLGSLKVVGLLAGSIDRKSFRDHQASGNLNDYLDAIAADMVAQIENVKEFTKTLDKTHGQTVVIDGQQMNCGEYVRKVFRASETDSAQTRAWAKASKAGTLKIS